MARLDGKVAVITGAVSVTGAAMVVDGGFTAGGSTVQGHAPAPLVAGFAGPSFEDGGAS